MKIPCQKKSMGENMLRSVCVVVVVASTSIGAAWRYDQGQDKERAADDQAKTELKRNQSCIPVVREIRQEIQRGSRSSTLRLRDLSPKDKKGCGYDETAAEIKKDTANLSPLGGKLYPSTMKMQLPSQNELKQNIKHAESASEYNWLPPFLEGLAGGLGGLLVSGIACSIILSRRKKSQEQIAANDNLTVSGREMIKIGDLSAQYDKPHSSI